MKSRMSRKGQVGERLSSDWANRSKSASDFVDQVSSTDVTRISGTALPRLWAASCQMCAKNLTDRMNAAGTSSRPRAESLLGAMNSNRVKYRYHDMTRIGIEIAYCTMSRLVAVQRDFSLSNTSLSRGFCIAR